MSVDLDLTVHRGGQGYQADLRVHIAGNTAPIAPLPAPTVAIFDLARLRALSLDLRAYGAALTSMLFTAAELRTAFTQARAVAAQRSAPLRLRLTIVSNAEELHALRWEALADPEAPDQPLAASTQILFSRTLPSPDWQSVPVRAGGALRAVALVAAPADLPDYSLTTVDATQEVAQVRANLSNCALTVLGQEVRASLPNLLQHLHRGCDLLFVLAHGRADETGQTWLYLEDAAGHTVPVAGTELVMRIAALANKPRLIILGSCESAGNGSGSALAALGPQLVRAGVPAVLAMQGRITLETLGLFLPACLQNLQQHGQIDRAVTIARDLIRERPDWWVPALWMRATDGRLWTEPVRPSAPPNAALHQLRPPIADFVGHREDVARLTAELRRAQTEEGHIAAICGVRGMGGIGKTTLAEYVAHHLRSLFPDAQLVIDLRGASVEPLAPVQALQQLVRAFVPEEKLPDDLLALQARYRSLLDGRHALILADDAKDAAQVRPLLPPAGCALLVTSRQRFALDGMASLDLARLSDAEAIQLLQGICPRLSGDQAKRLAHFCGGLPLALRVSAGILLNDEALPVERYLTQFADERRRLAQLRDPDDPERDVAATLHLSYAALDLPTQEAFRCLGVLAADADLSLIAAVLEQSMEETEEVLRLLLRRSLVEYDTNRCRWGMHDLVRVFALERLAESKEEQAIRLRYASRVLHTIQQAEDLHQHGGINIRVGLTLFDRERVHLEAVRTWLWMQPIDATIDNLVIAEAYATHHIGKIRDPLRTIRLAQQERAIAAAQRQDNPYAYGRFIDNLGYTYYLLGEVDTSISFFEQWLKNMHKTGYRDRERRAVGSLRFIFQTSRNLLLAIRYLEKDLAMVRETGDRRGESITLGNLGLAYARLGRTNTAFMCHEQALTVMLEAGDHQGEALALNLSSRTHYLLGNFAEGLACCKDAHILAQKVQDRSLEGAILRHLANAQEALGQQGEANTNYLTSLAILDELGAVDESTYTRWIYGQFLIRQGKHERGLALMEECLAYEQQIGHAQADEHTALIAHLQAGGLPPFPAPLAAFAPLRHAIVAVAQGEEHLRPEAEAALAQWERRFYLLTAPVRAIWAGQRDPDALTAGLSTTDAALIRQVLTDLGVDCWGELLALGAIDAAAAA